MRRPVIVLLTEVSPCELGDELSAAGYEVFEAVSVSEVLGLFEERQVLAVAVTPGVQDDGLSNIRQRHITLHLKANATASEVVWELSNLVPLRRSYWF